MAPCIIVDSETNEQKTTRAALVGAVEKQQPPPSPPHQIAPRLLRVLDASYYSLYKTLILTIPLLLAVPVPQLFRRTLVLAAACYWNGVGGFMFNLFTIIIITKARPFVS